MKDIKLINGESEVELKKISSNSVDITFLDPPYLYLNQAWDVPFDEEIVFSEIKRVSKKDSCIIIFGRGIPFCRWQLKLHELGYKFLESISWDKTQSTSPLSAISRIHEDCVIFGSGKAKIHKRKLPYLLQKGGNIKSIISDIDRLMTVFNNPKSLKAVKDFLENNEKGYNSHSKTEHAVTKGKSLKNRDRCTDVMCSIEEGMRERSIVRVDREYTGTFTKHNLTISGDKEVGDRCVNVMQSIHFGMNEKSIIKEEGTILEVNRDHYNTIHGTQKPIELIVRLFNLCGIMPDMNVIDSFAGSASSGVASFNMQCNWIGIEKDKKHYTDAEKRLRELDWLLI